MTNTIPSLSPNTTDAEMLELLEKTGEQYQVYRELNDVVNIIRKPPPPPRVPSPENPLTTNHIIFRETE